MKKFYITLILAFVFNSLFAQNPVLWGTTEQGGANNKGVIMRINGDGTNFNTVYSFIDSTGSNPRCTLSANLNGKFYGTTYYGGTFNSAVLFSFDISNNIYNAVHNFNWTNGASRPGRGLIEAPNGLLYGVAGAGSSISHGKIFTLNPFNNQYIDVFNFFGIVGEDPFGKLILSTNSKLYGMVQRGGLNDYGVIFSFDPINNSYTNLHDFDSLSGGKPWGSMIEANNGKMYGMTWVGGSNNMGVIFSLDTNSNSYSVVFNFDSINGSFPVNNLMRANNGMLYGMAANGGSQNRGTLFSINPNNNSFNLLYDFNYVNGAVPLGGLMQASNGKLYGMTAYGGNYGWGVIFSYDIASNTLLKIHDFDGTNGAVPWEELVEIVPTGINEQFDKQYQYSIYPNPTNKALNFFLKNMEVIVITDVFGKIVLRKWTEGNVELDVSFLSSGIYFIKAGNEVRKFVKE